MASSPPNPNYGQTFTKGVKYIKIHKLDKNGENFSQRLSLADNLRINYPDVGVTQYNILTTQQQGDFYLLGIIPSETTSSINEILDFDFTASTTFNFTDTIVTADLNWNTNSDTLGYFDSPTGYYTFGITPNIPLKITLKGSITNLSSTNFYAIYYNTSEGGFVVTSSLINNATTDLLNFSFITTGSGLDTGSVRENLQHYIVLQNNQGTLLQTSLSWSIELAKPNSATPTTEILVGITPETANFDYSDYNAILGNATSPQFSTTYQNVSYDNGTLAPTNLDYIISGTAERALIQDSNYSQNSWINSRYNGTRVSSLDFNSYTKLTK
jgi:hypothetical protein